MGWEETSKKIDISTKAPIFLKNGVDLLVVGDGLFKLKIGLFVYVMKMCITVSVIS